VPTAFIGFMYMFGSKIDIINFFNEINKIRDEYEKEGEYAMVCVTRITGSGTTNAVTMIAEGSMEFIDDIINLIKSKYDKNAFVDVIELRR